jgi:hypothetical protein
MCKLGLFPLGQQQCKTVVQPVEEQAVVFKEQVSKKKTIKRLQSQTKYWTCTKVISHPILILVAIITRD